ncbi:uncharacterized protein LY79DRAFT_154975 [Colletotrichum navitas]|uniref:Uncharacterized protein n=1 Tax=Colletotrichum navitas TaxID=681940 RepID=A0AAD8V4W7_9PEZI|nr:uncharacterized protein LY79DRAFT_154975 [Colletotrichum navitas]KAK1594377.1 hypothetical protein LY79DRAFT_154975 [Colletotrichum navitas]
MSSSPSYGLLIVRCLVPIWIIGEYWRPAGYDQPVHDKQAALNQRKLVPVVASQRWFTVPRSSNSKVTKQTNTESQTWHPLKVGQLWGQGTGQVRSLINVPPTLGWPPTVKPLETSTSFALPLEAGRVGVPLKGAERRKTTVSIVTRNALQNGFFLAPRPSRRQNNERRHLALRRNLGNLKESWTIGVKLSMGLNRPHSCGHWVCFLRNGKSLNSDSPVFSSPRLDQCKCWQSSTNCITFVLAWSSCFPLGSGHYHLHQPFLFFSFALGELCYPFLAWNHYFRLSPSVVRCPTPALAPELWHSTGLANRSPGRSLPGSQPRPAPLYNVSAELDSRYLLLLSVFAPA